MKRINKSHGCSTYETYFYVFCSFYVTRDGWDSGEIMDGVFKLNKLPSLVELKRVARTLANKHYNSIANSNHRIAIINYKFIDEDEFKMLMSDTLLIGDTPVDGFYFNIDDYDFDEYTNRYKKKAAS